MNGLHRPSSQRSGPPHFVSVSSSHWMYAHHYGWSMAVRRLERGTRQKPVRLSLAVEESIKLRFEQLATHADVSGAVYFERMVAHLELTDRGLPTWWTEEPARDGELPIDTD